MCQVCMMGRLFMVACFVVLRRFLVMSCGVFVVFSGFVVDDKHQSELSVLAEGIGQRQQP